MIVMLMVQDKNDHSRDICLPLVQSACSSVRMENDVVVESV